MPLVVHIWLYCFRHSNGECAVLARFWGYLPAFIHLRGANLAYIGERRGKRNFYAATGEHRYVTVLRVLPVRDGIIGLCDRHSGKSGVRRAVGVFHNKSKGLLGAHDGIGGGSDCPVAILGQLRGPSLKIALRSSESGALGEVLIRHTECDRLTGLNVLFHLGGFKAATHWVIRLGHVYGHRNLTHNAVVFLSDGEVKVPHHALVGSLGNRHRYHVVFGCRGPVIILIHALADIESNVVAFRERLCDRGLEHVIFARLNGGYGGVFPLQLQRGRGVAHTIPHGGVFVRCILCGGVR